MILAKSRELCSSNEQSIPIRDDQSHNLIPRVFFSAPGIEFFVEKKMQQKKLRGKYESDTLDFGRNGDFCFKEEIAIIFQYLSVHRWKNKRTLGLICSKIKEKNFKIFGSKLGKQMGNLHKLSLDLNYSYWITERGTEKLGYMVGKHLMGLQQLKFKFEASGINHESLKILGFQLGKFSCKLKKLTVSLNSCILVSDKTLEAFSYQIGRSLPDLRHLELNFGRCERITEKGLQALGENIKRNLLNLQTLKLFFSSCHQLTNRGPEALIRVIGKESNKLTHLVLDFAGCMKKANQHVLLWSPDNFRKLHSLQELELDFSRCAWINDQGIKILKSELSRHLANLEKLSLKFIHCRISDGVIEELGSEVANHLLKLRNLNLSFELDKTKFELISKLTLLLRFIPTVIIE